MSLTVPSIIYFSSAGRLQLRLAQLVERSK
jgi:hypothetical protein